MPSALLYDPLGTGLEPEVIWAPLSEPQEQFLAAREDEILYGGAKGGAKTDSLVTWVAVPVTVPGYKGLLLRATFPELQEILDRAIERYVPMGATWRAGESRFVWSNGASIEIGYCERLDHVNRYQGREFGRIGYDEIGNLPDERVWDKLLAEVRSKQHDVPRGAACTANPGGAGHAWLKRRFIVPCGRLGARVHTYAVALPGGEKVMRTRRFIPARVTDNPIYANDPSYLATLAALPERMRQQLQDGNWDVGEGLALDELDERMHIVEWFAPPKHWFAFGALDWGYQHKFSFGYFVVSPEGAVYLAESVHGWRLLPHEQTERIRETLALRELSLSALRYTTAGADVKNVIRARGEATPSIAEQYADAGIPLMARAPSRITSLDNLRRYLSVRRADGTTGQPRFRIMDTPGNRATFDCLSAMVCDPDNVEDALKVDTDPMTGEGGDDPYDMVRYALASRPITPSAPKQAAEPDTSESWKELSRRMRNEWRPSGSRGGRAVHVPRPHEMEELT